MSIQKKEDRRVRYTKKAIKDSFLELFETKPLEKISVTEICNNADINRGTFYSHYSDPYDLKNKLEEEFLSTIRERITEATNNHRNKISTAQALAILKENRELCRVFMGPNGDFKELIHIVGSQASSYLRDMYGSIKQHSPENAECLQLMMASCITAVIKYWFDSGMAQDPEIIAEAIDKFFKNGLGAFIPTGDI